MAPAVGMWSSETWESAAEPYLLARAREGADEALAELWRRTLPEAYARAAAHPEAGYPEVLVTETAWLVVDEMQQGRGPVDSFTGHVLEVLDDVVAGAGFAGDEDGFPFRRLDPDLVQAAFGRLPELEQRVLWHTTLEGRSPRSVAPALGLSHATVGATAGRARGVFRREYLKVLAAYHPLQGESQDCAWVVQHLPAHVRGQLPAGQAHRLRAHVELCDHDRRLMARLHAVHDDFPALVVPLVLLAGLWTPGFLADGAELALLGVAAGPEVSGEGHDDRPPAREGTVRGLAGYVTSVVAALAVLVAGASVGLSGPARTAPPPPAAAPAPAASVEETAEPEPEPSTPDAPTPTTTSPRTPAPTTTTTEPEPTSTPSPTPTTTSAPKPPTTTLRVYSSGGVTRFGLQFASAAGFDLVVSNASGDGRLSVDNGAFSCSSPSKSTVSCRGGDGILKLTQGGLGGAEPVVIRITDSSGAVHTSTVSLG